MALPGVNQLNRTEEFFYGVKEGVKLFVLTAIMDRLLKNDHVFPLYKYSPIDLYTFSIGAGAVSIIQSAYTLVYRSNGDEVLRNQYKFELLGQSVLLATITIAKFHFRLF